MGIDQTQSCSERWRPQEYHEDEDPAARRRGKGDNSAAEKMCQLIQESKFLGGDMEHTHLVKGLDFALLQKTRAEIASNEKEEEDIMEKVQKEVMKDEDSEQKMEFKTRLGRNIYSILFKSRLTERNELFLPGRMAYVVDLEDEYANTDIPTMLIRSKVDCPAIEAQARWREGPTHRGLRRRLDRGVGGAVSSVTYAATVQ
ncbi:hypothetical protein SKAU_G00267270 [Synaphobranchus kaupii]|uniref:RED-like N-terminal domain-containing protein n=1 Tax=Synaphobranchus kaupii TaxID=118154 RepID=A0A9Q1EZL5_SYNKA|nr:hypothetical protein SKAU_G00267270 [Synaphobranchus kaupii]